MATLCGYDYGLRVLSKQTLSQQWLHFWKPSRTDCDSVLEKHTIAAIASAGGGGGGTGRLGQGVQGLFQIGQQIGHILDAHGQADQVFRHGQLGALDGGVSHLRRVVHERFNAAQ